jgi:hypothetical protein
VDEADAGNGVAESNENENLPPLSTFAACDP